MKDFDLIAELIGFACTASQTEQTFQIISLILTCIATLFSIVSRLIVWYKQAKQDGKITKEELKEAEKIVNEELNNKKGQ